tara:strand:+ start:1121 stop:1639 length:519 start_codon:yes stop_codon:yes gene_type:complete
MKDIDNTIKGLFLLILAVAGNFVGETLGCKTQKLLSENMLAKHFVIILILYFAIDFTSEKLNTPFDTFKLALIIYIFFILFTKINSQFTLLILILLAFIYVINGYINYYKKNDKKNPIIKKLEDIKNLLYISTMGFILLGFGLYFIKQRRDYSKNWSTTKFLFGTRKCKSVK